MAELAIKVGANSTYEDGDILCAFNARRIGCVHMEHICDHRKFALVNGLRPVGTLAEFMKATTRQYKFERISPTVVRRTEISSSKDVELGPAPSASGEHIDVPMYLARRMARNDHGIFGVPGSEVWYGGRTDVSETKVDAVWVEIESETAYRRVDFARWPAGTDDLKVHLFLTVDEFDDAGSRELIVPLLDEASLDPTPPILYKRKHHINWQTDLALTAKEKTDIQDADQSVDIRDKPSLNHSGILKTKTAPSP